MGPSNTRCGTHCADAVRERILPSRSHPRHPATSAFRTVHDATNCPCSHCFPLSRLRFGTSFARRPRRAPSRARAARPLGGKIAQPHGSLVIVGGGPRGDAITEKFIALAGGAGKARILVLPMASSLPETGAESVAEWRKHGASAWSENLTREEAMRPETVRGLDSATGIWFPGGDQVRIMAVLDGTPTA